jgi:S1-C subfamily serine protease
MGLFRAVYYFLIGIVLGSGLAVISYAKTPEQIYRDVGGQVVKVLTGKGMGTGFGLKTEDGKVYVMTNLHICEGSLDGQHLQFQTQGGETYNTVIIGVSDKSDICILDGLELFPGVGMADKVDNSAMVHVLGHPKGYSLKYSIGYLLGRAEIEMPYGGVLRLVDSYQSSALILPGNSGSPVVNNDGNLVAMAYALEGDGTSWMIPLDRIKEFLNGI